MTNETLQKLRKHTTEIRDIMFLAQSAFKIVDYLHRQEDTMVRECIAQNRFLVFSRETYWRTYVIELAKLFSGRSSDHFNLQDFINKFKPGNEFEIKIIDKYSIKIWEQNLVLEKLKIDNLIQQRDKLYSHTDKKRGDIQNILSFKDAKELVQVVQRIVSEIYIAVFNEVSDFNPIGEPLVDLKKMVGLLVEDKKQFMEAYRQHALANGIDPKELGL